MSKHVKPVVFPRDHGAHDTIIEWWYFNGHVRDRAGKRYSFMNCLFKADIRKVNIPFLSKLPFKERSYGWPHVFFAHSVVSDISRQRNEKSVQNISLVSRDSFLRDRLFINYIDPLIFRSYVNHEIAEREDGSFHMKSALSDLTLVPKKKPLLEGGKGHITVCGKETYYYSLTDLAASGCLTIDGKRIAVEGKAWMDHQWADVPYSKDKWSWFSVQLDNGLDVMCVEYDDGTNVQSGADVIDAHGKATHGDRVLLMPGPDRWKSRKTKAEYPLSWDIDIPERRIRLHVRSLMEDQEMIYGSINYWEGPLEVSGNVQGKSVKGVGYMELVGYPSDYNYMLLAGKELRTRLRSAVGRLFEKKRGL